MKLTRAAASSRTLMIAAATMALVVMAPAAFAQKAKAKTPPKKSTVGTLGTEQAKGGDGRFGTTYTIANSGGYMYNITIASAEYSVARFNLNKDSSVVPKEGEKLLLLHLLIQNPKPNDLYVGGNAITFSTVAADEKTRDECSTLRRASAKEELADTLKPGQKFPEEVLVACTVPASGPVPKLILNMGRKDTNEEVVRYFLGKTPNVIKPLPAPYADPADASGATAFTETPAKIGTAYATGFYDFQVTGASYVPGPIGETAAGDGKKFLVVTLVVANKTWGSHYLNNFIDATLTTADDEKTKEFEYFKGKRDEKYEGVQIEAGDTMTFRLVFTVPKDTTGKKLKIAEVLDNSGTKGHALTFDLSSIQ